MTYIVSDSIDDGSFREFILDLEEQEVSNKRKLPVSNPELAQHYLDQDDDEEEVE